MLGSIHLDQILAVQGAFPEYPADLKVRTQQSIWKMLFSGVSLGIHFGCWVYGIQHTCEPYPAIHSQTPGLQQALLTQTVVVLLRRTQLKSAARSTDTRIFICLYNSPGEQCCALPLCASLQFAYDLGAPAHSGKPNGSACFVPGDRHRHSASAETNVRGRNSRNMHGRRRGCDADPWTEERPSRGGCPDRCCSSILRVIQRRPSTLRFGLWCAGQYNGGHVCAAWRYEHHRVRRRRS